MNPYASQLYIDGSCYNNPGGAGGLAGILEIPEGAEKAEEVKIIFQKGYFSTTNNRMEIRALIEALEYIKNNNLELRSMNINQIEIQSDSETTVKCYYQAEKWRANSWKGINNTPISNVDLIKNILTLKNSVKFSYTVNHILNKSTEPTKLVDNLAKNAAKHPAKHDFGYIKPRVCRTQGSGKTQLFEANGQELEIRIYEHVPANSRKDSLYKVKFEITDNGEIKKCLAYCSEAINSTLHRHHYYKSKFNSDKNNPMIEMVEEIKK
jgi:ribonuclease HI